MIFLNDKDSLPKIAIVLVNWNGKTDTLECLQSLREDRYPVKRIIVIDNGSSDDSVYAIRQAFPEVTVLETGANLGFTGGNNVGIQFALQQGTDYIYLLNNDTTVEPDALQFLVQHLEQNTQVGLAAPVIHYFHAPMEIWFGGSLLNIEIGKAVHDNSRVLTRADEPQLLPWMTGCAMLLRSEVIKKLKGFDDRFFLYWEDVDLSLRIRQSGVQIALVPAARIHHKVSQSAQKISHIGQYYYVRNHLLLIRLHAGKRQWRATAAVLNEDLRAVLRAVRRRDKGAILNLRMTLLAITHHCMRRYGSLS